MARGKVYDEDLICEAPEIKKTKREKDHLLLEFSNVGEKFILHGNSIHGLQVFVDGSEVDAVDSKVAENGIRIHLKDLVDAKHVVVRYAWTDYVEVNLYSSAGLPAKPFRVRF